MKITDQNADLLQFVEKYFTASPEEKILQLILQYYATVKAFGHTVLAESNCIGHDGTSYAVLKFVEVEF